ncbi:MAG: trypsin-like serine protease [Candidatus Binatia bacterium]
MTRISRAALAAVGFSLSAILPVLFAILPAPDATAGSTSTFGREERVTNGVLSQDRPTTGALLLSFGNNHQAICSGTLIGCETFLTAAHCVCEGSPFAFCGIPNPAEYSVYLQDIGIVGVSAIDVDPTYSFTNQGDVAVLTLSSPVSGVAPTPINTLMRPPFGTSAEIAGYGITRGGADDSGMLRRGLAETSACTDADPDSHVCWAFTSPLGVPGLDSNSCNGDSGGPLFADLGDGISVVGITSGGTATDCLPEDASYDSDVFVHAAYIDGVAGADLLNTSCGSIAQVGEIGADRAVFDFDLFSKQQQACRKEVAREYTAYVTAALKASQGCLSGVADGKRTGPCPDGDAVEALARAAGKVSLAKLTSKCPDNITPVIDAGGLCAAAGDAADLAACNLAAGDIALADALSSEYADDNPMGPIGDGDAVSCQKAVGKSSAALLRNNLKAATRCQVSLAAGKTAACPDAKASARIAKAEAKATVMVQNGCTDGAVAVLDAAATFGGTCAGVTTAAALSACEIVDHAVIRDDLLALLADQAMESDVSFTVPPGAALLRVTLNGLDNGLNDLDIYVRAGSPATTVAFDASSENGGMFEHVEIAAPAAGTWHVHVARFAGDTRIPYQLTATAFQP